MIPKESFYNSSSRVTIHVKLYSYQELMHCSCVADILILFYIYSTSTQHTPLAEVVAESEIQPLQFTARQMQWRSMNEASVIEESSTASRYEGYDLHWIKIACTVDSY